MAFQITDANLMNVDSQFLFMITDTDISDTDVTMNLERAKDGNNLAFIYNTSKSKGTSACAVNINPQKPIVCLQMM